MSVIASDHRECGDLIGNQNVSPAKYQMDNDNEIAFPIFMRTGSGVPPRNDSLISQNIKIAVFKSKGPVEATGPI